MDPKIKEKYFIFYRSEVEILNNKYSMILCGITLMPIRIILINTLYFVYYLILKLIWIGSNYEEPLPKWKYKIVNPLHKCVNRVLLFFFGYYRINFIRKRIQEYDPDYPE